MLSDRPRADVIRQRFNVAAWGLLMAWSGALILMPGDLAVLWHAWLVGTGAILIGATLVAQSLGLDPDRDGLLLGAVGIVSGVGGFLGVPISAIGLAMLLFGGAFVLAAVRASFGGAA